MKNPWYICVMALLFLFLLFSCKTLEIEDIVITGTWKFTLIDSDGSQSFWTFLLEGTQSSGRVTSISTSGVQNGRYTRNKEKVYIVYIYGRGLFFTLKCNGYLKLDQSMVGSWTKEAWDGSTNSGSFTAKKEKQNQ